MNNLEYIPNILYLSSVELPENLKPLIEKMASNVHDIWAQGRIAQGWTYGHERNDIKKTHPCLIPYDKLPESEKEYDRQTAIATIKFILYSGYDIVEKSE